MYVTVLPVASKTYFCSPKANNTSSILVMKRVLQLISGFGLSINGKHTYCGDYIYSGHTVVLVLSYLIIKECTYFLRTTVIYNARDIKKCDLYLKIHARGLKRNGLKFRFSEKMSTDSLAGRHCCSRWGDYGLSGSWTLYRGRPHSVLRNHALMVYLSYVS